MQVLVQWAESIAQWAQANQSWLWWLAGASLLLVVAAVLLVPWLVLRIPSDYFSMPGRYRSAMFGNHWLAIIIFKCLRNTLALVLVAVGVILLFLPGQGLITIFLGVVMADFPGKHRLVNWLVGRQGVLSSMNWWRARYAKPPIEPPVSL